MASSVCPIFLNRQHADHDSLDSGFGSVCNIPSPKSQSPKNEPASKARRPVINSDSPPHANWPARLPRFPKIFEEGEGALEENCC